MLETIKDPAIAKYIKDMPEALQIPFLAFLKEKSLLSDIQRIRFWTNEFNQHSDLDILLATIIDRLLYKITSEIIEAKESDNCKSERWITIAAGCLITIARDMLSMINPSDESNH